MRINLEMPDDINARRTNLNVTWRELIMAGLHTLEGKPQPIDPLIEDHLKKALSGITDAWKIVKNHVNTDTKGIPTRNKTRSKESGS